MILLNRVKCLICEELVVSSHRHDYRSCKCGNVAADGGTAYLRRTFKDENKWEERSIYTGEWDGERGRKMDLSGLWLIFSPSGTTNPSTFFCHKEDAEFQARLMEAQFRASFYVAQIQGVK